MISQIVTELGTTEYPNQPTEQMVIVAQTGTMQAM